MNVKKIMTVLVVTLFAMSSMAFAARGGAKISAPKAAPSISTSKNAPAASSPSTKEYTPSKDAKSLSKDAPTTGTGAAASAAAKSSSPWGGMMRNIGLLAGGMMLGSLLGSMFGMGSGLFADILGLLMNVVLIGAVFMIGRLLWNKLRGRNSGAGTNPYRSQSAAPPADRREDVVDVTPRQTGDSSYDSKRKADEYRNR
ncbi:MAG: hypothetical protein ACRCZU_13030 [Selenomonadaceae bacterium]